MIIIDLTVLSSENTRQVNGEAMGFDHRLLPVQKAEKKEKKLEGYGKKIHQ